MASQSIDHEPEDEWELSKENVQPLKQGRKFANLTASLQPNAADLAAMLKKQKHEFELELRRAADDESLDKLDVWDRYIKWTEQNYPKGGKDSNLSAVLERCIVVFKDEEGVKNDPRYVHAWLKFVNMCNEPLEIYNHMYSQSIGSRVSDFYLAWAWELEQTGNMKKANSVLQEAVTCGAQPHDRLMQGQREFQVRFAHRFFTEDDTAEDSPSSDGAASGPQRAVLGALRGQGKRKEAPTNRVGAAQAGRKGIKTDSHVPITNNIMSGQAFTIFSEEDPSSRSLPTKSSKPVAPPILPEVRKENEQKAGVWTSAKVSQKTTSGVKISEVSRHSKPRFTVHEDENVEQPLVTPRKIAERNDVLSAKKPEKPTDILHTLRHQESGQPMYCKKKVYCGVAEFQFEELRAEQYMRRCKERAIEDERKKLLAEQEEFRRQKEEFLRQQEELIQMAQQQKLGQLQNHGQNLGQPHSQPQQNQSVTNERLIPHQQQQHDIEMRGEPEIRGLDHEAQEESMEQGRGLPQAQTTKSRNEGKVNRGLSFVSETTPHEHGNTENIPPHVLAQLKMSTSQVSTAQRGPEAAGNTRTDVSTVQPLNPASASCADRQRALLSADTSGSLSGVVAPLSNTSGSLSRSRPTPDSFYNSFMNKSSTKTTPSLGALTAPSPTVNTREAIQVVMGMFNNTLDINKDVDREFEAQFALTDEPDCHMPASPAFPVNGIGGFEIYDETKESNSKQPAFQIYDENQENKPLCDAQSRPWQKPMSSSGFPDPAPNPSPGVAMDGLDDGEIISGPAKDEDDIEMEGLENFNCEMTFAPHFSSTCNFTKAAAQLMSTPFPGDTGPAPLDAPPLSKIRPPPDAGNLETRAALKDAADGTIMQHDLQGVPVTLSSVTPGSTTAQGVNSFDISTMQAAKKIDLSPIMEMSDESTKSSHSSHGSTMATTFNNVTNQHQTLHHGSHLNNTNLHHSLHQSVNNKKQERHLLGNASQLSNLNSSQASQVTQGQGSSAGSLSSLSQSQPRMNLMKAVMPPVEEQTNSASFNQTFHEIDTTGYVKSPYEAAGSVDILSMSIAIDPYDPFDDDLVAKFLRRLPQPISSYANYVPMDQNLPVIRADTNIELAGRSFHVASSLGIGGFASVFKVVSETEEEIALKVQKPACPWEFYICTELHRRVAALGHTVDVRPSLMQIDQAYFYNDGSVFSNELMRNGTLLSVVNIMRDAGIFDNEALTMYITIELLHIAIQLQRCHIIHGDIKPDNFLFNNFPTLQEGDTMAQMMAGRTQAVKLIDFGRSIDMTMFPENTTFTAKVKTSGFQCIEMKTDRPWTYQTDLFGIAGTIHVFAFQDYMKVYQEKGVWKHTKSLKRRWQHNDLWRTLFHSLLNIESCEHLPDLSALCSQFEEAFVETMLDVYNTAADTIIAVLK